MFRLYIALAGSRDRAAQHETFRVVYEVSMYVYCLLKLTPSSTPILLILLLKTEFRFLENGFQTKGPDREFY